MAVAQEWPPLTIPRSIFTSQIGMLDTEREDYARQLAGYAATLLVVSNGSDASRLQTRKILALALQLAPRCKEAIVLNFQLANRILPEATPTLAEADILAKLLFSRGKLLQQQDGEENQRLARIFIQLAAEMDPRNVDVVYASEVNRLDHGPVDWNALMSPSN